MKMKLFAGTLAMGLVLSAAAKPDAPDSSSLEPGIRPRWSGAEVGAWTMDYNAAFDAAATNENCRGVVMYYSGLWWCPYCRALEQKVLWYNDGDNAWNDYAASNSLYLISMDYPSRAGNSRWCWLWDDGYTAEAGLTGQEAEDEILRRYQVQSQYADMGANPTYNAAFDYYQIGYPVMLLIDPKDRTRVMGRTSFPDFNGTSYNNATATAAVLTQVDQLLETDPEDEADKYWYNATALDVSACEGAFVVFGDRTLSPRDTYDWYAFDSARDTAWTFAFTPGARGATNSITVAVYANPTGSSVKSQSFVPSEGTTVTYVTPGSGTYYLRVARGGAQVLQGYRLAYKSTLLGIPFDEYAAAHKDWNLKSTGMWYYGQLPEGDATECLYTMLGDAPATVSGTWAGPGALLFTCQRKAGAEMTLLVNGAAVTNDFVDGGACWVALPAGAQTVTWSVEGPAGAAGAVGGIAFAPLAAAVPLSPTDKSFASCDMPANFFSWADAGLPDPVTARYLFYVGEKASALALPPVPGAAEAFAAAYWPRAWPYDEADLNWTTDYLAAAAGKTFCWRVDTVIEDAYGRSTVVQGKVSSVNIVGADAPTIDTGALPPEYGVSGGSVETPPLTVGVQAMLGPFALANVGPGAKASVAVRNGKLPAGLKVQVIDGAAWLVGVPKTADAGKSGAADLILSVKPAGGKTVQGTSVRVAWSVAALGRAAGNFNGFLAVDDEPGYGDIRMTVSASGKISGTFRHEGVRHTFSAKNFDGVDGGLLMLTNAVARAGKAARGVSLAVGTAEAPEATLTLNEAGDSDFVFLLYRSNWADAAPMGANDALANYVGYYTAALPVETRQPLAVAPLGTGYLTLTVNQKGTVKYAGAVADGQRVSGSAALLYGPDCCSATDRLMFALLAIPRGSGAGSGLYGVIQLVPGDSHAITDVTLVPAHTHLAWVNTDPKSVYGYDETTGLSSETVLGFTNILDVVGGYYVRSAPLMQHYGTGTVLAFEPRFEVPQDFDGKDGASGFELLSLPVYTNLPMTVTAATKLTAPVQKLVKDGRLVNCDESVNPWGLSFTFRSATGLFRSSFKAYYQNGAGTQKTKRFTVKGVFVPTRALYSDTADWYGFYLVSDKCHYLDAGGNTKTYPFKWSYDVRLGVPEPTP
ncbi:MAG: hypothetical protein FWG50_07550 [Kiritimatiellaeota bacterium]|nr:hypothetical protein [Kiritimatiellota bacterium]